MITDGVKRARRIRQRWIWIAVVVVLLLLLPMLVAERYTSPTQDGQYLLHPLKSYRFVIAAIGASMGPGYRSGGEALERAKVGLADSLVRPTKVELLFLPSQDAYAYTTPGGEVLEVTNPPAFLWEVWGVPALGPAGSKEEVVALMDYRTGEMLASTG